MVLAILLSIFQTNYPTLATCNNLYIDGWAEGGSAENDKGRSLVPA
jgi:hypothetical protein